jgi:outer membrane murein-binding lipoprotein Lpp
METGGLNGQKTVNRVEKLSSMVTDLTTEFAQLGSDNAILKVHIRDLQDVLAAQSNTEAAARTLVFRTRGYVLQGRPSKQSTFSTGEDCQQPKTPGIQPVLLINPRLQVQQSKLLLIKNGVLLM